MNILLFFYYYPLFPQKASEIVQATVEIKAV